MLAARAARQVHFVDLPDRTRVTAVAIACCACLFASCSLCLLAPLHLCLQCLLPSSSGERSRPVLLARLYLAAACQGTSGSPGTSRECHSHLAWSCLWCGADHACGVGPGAQRWFSPGSHCNQGSSAVTTLRMCHLLIHGLAVVAREGTEQQRLMGASCEVQSDPCRSSTALPPAVPPQPRLAAWCDGGLWATTTGPPAPRPRG